MNIRVDRRMHLVGGVLLLTLVAGGCRSYGGYGSEAALADQIQQTAERFAADFARAQGERDALQRAAAANPALAPLADRFATVLAHQEAVVEAHRMLAAEAAEMGSGNILFDWVGPDSYRALHRAYGALISDQQIIEDRYGEVLHALQQAVGAPARAPVDEVGRYQVAPHFYDRLTSGGPGSVAEILAQAAPASAAPAADTEPSAPETAPTPSE